MEPACWGIKFKPIIKKVKTDDSKYYLEIIPEVSCLKNFDKIEWKHDNVFYEYVIPMAYKVIVKRDKDIARDEIDRLEPVYHSCVDLLRSSPTNACWASGDLNRIFSDTTIFSKLVTNFDSCKTTPKDTRLNSTYDLKYTNPRSMQTVEKREDFMLTQCKIEETFTATKSTVLIQVGQNITSMDTQENTFELNNIVQNEVEKGTHTNQSVLSPISIGLSDIHLLDTDLSDDLINEEQEVVPERKPDHFMQGLSLSPICSIIVKTEPPEAKPPQSNENIIPIISYDEPTNKNIVPCNNTLCKDEILYNVITARQKNYELQSESNVHIRPLKRIAPEIRVKYYLNMIHKEVLPLNNMLDGILKKYSALNISVNDFVKSDICKKHPKTLKMLEDKEITAEPAKSDKSNRVVYTFVFDG